jgi:hypothetical protein
MNEKDKSESMINKRGPASPGERFTAFDYKAEDEFLPDFYQS